MTVVEDDGLWSCDLVALSSAFKVCDLEVVVLGTRGPKAAFGSQMHRDVLFYSGETDFSFRGRFALPLDWCLVGYIHHTHAGSWCHGTELASGMAFTVLPEGISEFLLSAGSQVSVMLVPLQRVRETYARLEPYGTDLPARQLSLFRLPQNERGRSLHDHFNRIFYALNRHHPSPTVDLLEPEAVDELLAQHLTTGLAATADDRPQCSRGRRTHYLIVQRTEQFMRANLRRDIYSQEICNAAGVSERALRYAFDDLLGVSPHRFLSMLRLCMACRNLSLADSSRRTVKSVALSCGLWDLSRFANNYRRVFGELPHDTLMRPPPREAAVPEN